MQPFFIHHETGGSYYAVSEAQHNRIVGVYK